MTASSDFHAIRSISLLHINAQPRTHDDREHREREKKERKRKKWDFERLMTKVGDEEIG